MANWNNPTLTDEYNAFLQLLKERDNDLATMFEGGSTNQPVGSIRWNTSLNRFERWGGSAWQARVLALSGGGTGAGSAAAARSNLGLGSVATQNTFPIANGGTGATTAANAFNAIKQNATTGTTGVVELATNAETQAGTDSNRVVTPAGLSSRTATTTRAGVVELATLAETRTGTDSTRAVTPSVLKTISDEGVSENRVNLNIASAPNRGNLTGGTLMLRRSGGVVTIGTNTGIFYTSGTSALSDTNFISPQFRPSSGTQQGVFYFNSKMLLVVRIQSNGRLDAAFLDLVTGDVLTSGSTLSFSFSFVVV